MACTPQRWGLSTEDNTDSSRFNAVDVSETSDKAQDNILEELIADDEDRHGDLTNTFEVEDREDLDDGWLPSAEQLQEAKILPKDAKFDVPSPSEWKDLEGSEAVVQLSVDRARRENWQRCRAEIQQINDNVKGIPETMLGSDEQDVSKGLHQRRTFLTIRHLENII